jgi:hypothetical protein
MILKFHQKHQNLSARLMNCYLNEIAGLIHRLSQALVQRPELESSGPAVLGAERSIN